MERILDWVPEKQASAKSRMRNYSEHKEVAKRRLAK